MKNKWTVQDSLNLYKIDRWGEGYFDINEKGELCVLPSKNPLGPRISIPKVIKEMRTKGISLPAVIRFQDILRSQVSFLNELFSHAIKEQDYQGNYYGVFPIKVNQVREVVEEIVDAGAPYHYGLEAGSKAELLSILSLNKNPESLNILNGYKDEECLKLALLGIASGKKCIVVIEKMTELPLLIRISKEMGLTPLIGVRAKLHSRSAGQWADSSGKRAKFGLSSPEIIHLVETLKKENMLHCLKLFHFHIGSQIPDIGILRNALKEGVRTYSQIKHLGADLEFLDVGGGAGLNYDGDFSGNPTSVNYSLNEYVEQVIEIIKFVCDEEEISHPHIISESGRVVTGYHSCIVTDVFGHIKSETNYLDSSFQEKENPRVTQMRSLFDSIDAENYHDSYNRAKDIKEESLAAFNLGVLSLREKSLVEEIFEKIITGIILEAEKDANPPQEIWELIHSPREQYLCNFSLFQSIPDVWAIKQILPIVPVKRLNEKPCQKVIIADLTCDSDGKVKVYSGEDGEMKNYLFVHSLEKNKSYPIGFFLTGAYQDVMGDMHNLFGRLNEVHIFADDEDPEDFYIEEYIPGSSPARVLSILQYNPELMVARVKKSLDAQVKQGKLKPRKGVELVDFYEEVLNSYTYLKY